MRSVRMFVGVAAFAAIVTLTPSLAQALDEPTLRAEAAHRDSARKLSEDEAAAKAYLRLGAWNLQVRASARAAPDIDLATIAEVCRRFNVLALQDSGPEENIQAITTLVSATSGKTWHYARVEDGISDPVLLWDSSLVTLHKQKVFRPPTPGLTSPILVGEFEWNGHPFYLAVSQVYRAGDAANGGRAEARQFMASVFSRFKRTMPPLFVGMSTLGDTPPEDFDFLNAWVGPVVKTGDLNLGSGKPRPDNILTNFRRPVRTGPYPYHRALIIQPGDATARVSGHLPIIMLSSLAD